MTPPAKQPPQPAPAQSIPERQTDARKEPVIKRQQAQPVAPRARKEPVIK